MDSLVKTKSDSGISDRTYNRDAVERQDASVARTAFPPGFRRAVEPLRHPSVEASENLAMSRAIPMHSRIYDRQL
jgi:hypothetical protein